MNEITHLIKDITNLMISLDYIVTPPVSSDIMAGLMQAPPPAEWDDYKKEVYRDIQKLLINRQDYTHLFSSMDGLECNGLTIYNLTQSENKPQNWSNIYIQNIDTRNNDIYEDQNLKNKVIFGEDGISLFTYNFDDDTFEIRDRIASDYIIESHKKFGDFLTSIITTIS